MERIVRVPSNDFSSERFDTGFYSKEYYEARNKLNSSGFTIETIGSVCEPWQFGAYALCSEIEWSQDNEGVCFIKAEGIESPLLNESNLSFVTKKTHQLLYKSALKSGDIIVSTSGTVGRLAVIPENIQEANSNQDTIKFSLEGTEYDSYFVASWLTSKYAQAYMGREAGGAVQQHIYLYNFKRLPLIKPNVLIQKYIGEKVRQAERLRAWSGEIIKDLKHAFKSLYKSIDGYKEFDRKSYRLNSSHLLETLTPESYPPHIEKYFEQNEYVKLSDISQGIYIGKTLQKLESDIAVLQATSRSCSGMFFKQPMNMVRKDEKVTPLKQRDIVLTNAAHDKRYIGKDVTFNHSSDFILPSAKVIVIRPNENGLPASYIHSYLMTEAGYTQLQSIIRGISAGIKPSDVGRIRIPHPKNGIDFEGIAERADTEYISAGYANEYARLLTAAAKLLVEELIEGNISEAELVTAQHALNAGDDSLDRALLERMTAEGVDGDGDPLFDDIDQLYDLLEQAKQALDGEDTMVEV